MRPSAGGTGDKVRLGIVAGAIASVLLVGACAPAGPVPSAPDLTPVPGAVDPIAQGSFAPPSLATVTGAIDALDTLTSYRFVESRGIPPVQTQGVVINGDKHRVRTDTMSGGAVSMSLIQIDSKSWISIAGSAYQGDDIGMGGPDDPVGMPVEGGDSWVGPIASEMGSLVSGLGSVTDLGVELRNGLAVRHLRATGSGEMTADENGDPIGDGFEGVVETWIAVDGGYLAGVRAVGTYAGMSSDNGEPSGAPEPYRLEVTIAGANDIANRVDEPVTPDPTVMPSGDPAIVALLGGVVDGLGRLTSYVATITSGAAGVSMTATISVVNRPVEALLLETSGVAGSDGISSLVVGGKAWSREGDGPWVTDSEGGMGGLCQGSSEGAAACAIGSVIGMDALASMAGAFAVEDADEAVGGVSTTHLHSSSGMPSVGISIPGAMDLWIANEGGHLVKYAFDGQGLEMALEIGRINDPAIVIEAPAAASSTPGAPTAPNP